MLSIAKPKPAWRQSCEILHVQKIGSRMLIVQEAIKQSDSVEPFKCSHTDTSVVEVVAIDIDRSRFIGCDISLLRT